jgi:hypothetical protein
MSERLVFELQAVDRATAPLKAVQAQVARTAANINGATSSMRSFAQGSALANTATQKWAKGALQQAGFQVGDFAVQVANGTNSLQAFGQQAPQLLQIFGPAGAVIGAAVAIIAALGVVAQKSGKDLSDMGSALGVLQAPLAAIVELVKVVGTAIGSVFGNMSGEIDTAIIAIGLFAGVMAVRAVPALFAATGASTMFAAAMATFRAAVVASALSAGTFSTALTLARASVMTLGAAVTALGTLLMRLLPVVLLIGLAKMIELFLRLKEGAGGFGEAMKLLGDLVKAIFSGMVASGQAAVEGMNGAWLTLKSGFMSALSFIQTKWGEFLYSLSGGMQGIPGLEDAANRLGGLGMEVMSKASSTAVNAGQVAAEADAAFANAASNAASAWSGVGDAWDALKGAVAAGTQEVNIFGDASAGAADKAGGAAKKAVEELTQQQENMKAIASSIRDAFSGAFMSMVDGTKSVKDAFRDMARSIIMKLYEVLVVQRIVNGIMGFVGKAFPALAPFINTAWNGGGVTGNKPVLVGEKGPEIIVPSRNSQVVANHQMGGGGVTVNQSISFGAGVTRAEIQAMLPKIVESTKAAVFDAQRRSVNGMGYA